MISPNAAVSAECVTCGAPMDSAFCPECGERRADDRSHTMRAIGEELWEAFSPIDGRIVRTVWTLVRRPGELTAAYMRGVRLPYVPPLRLFVLVNLAFFLHASLVGNRTFDTPLVVHLQSTWHQEIAKRAVIRHVPPLAGETSVAYNKRLSRDFEPRFNRNSTTQAKSLVIAIVPMFALLVGLIEIRRRRPALQHLVFALHAVAVMLILIMLSHYVLEVPLAWAGVDPNAVDPIATVPIVGALALWLRGALRRAYGDGKLSSVVLAMALAYGFALVLFAYRALLFFTTLAVS